MAKKSILQDAIADAKELKQVALENAKAAMNETFAPELKKLVDASLREELDEETKSSEEEIKEGESWPGAAEFKKGEKKDWSMQKEEKKKSSEDDSEEKIDEDLDGLDALLKELESEDDGKYGKEEDGKPMDEKEEDPSEEPDMEETKKDDEADAPPAKQDDREYQIYLKLRKKFEPEVKEDEAPYEAGAESGEEETDYDIDEDSIEAIIRELEKGSEEEKSSEEKIDEKHGDPETKGKHGQPVKEGNKFGKSEEDGEKGKPMDETKKKSSEEMNEVAQLKAEIKTIVKEFSDVNLLNAKLLYLNKIINENELTKSEKVSLLKQFDRASNVKEVKLIHTTISEALKSRKASSNKTKNQIKESLGFGSKPMGNAPKKESKDILNENSTYNRFQILAGLKKVD